MINATYGRRTRAVIVMDSEHVVLSAILPDKISRRIEGEEVDARNEEG